MNIGAGVRRILAAALLAGAGRMPARAAPALYAGEGGWFAVAGLPADFAPSDDPWNFVDGAWIGGSVQNISHFGLRQVLG